MVVISASSSGTPTCGGRYRRAGSRIISSYGAGRRTWRSLDHFKAYLWCAVVAHKLVLFARLKPRWNLPAPAASLLKYEPRSIAMMDKNLTGTCGGVRDGRIHLVIDPDENLR
jgi:hypothetical protein